MLSCLVVLQSLSPDTYSGFQEITDNYFSNCISVTHFFFFFLLAFCTSISSLLLLQYHGQFHIFLEALLCMAPVFVPVEVPVRARDRGTEVKARFISVYTLNHQGGQLSFRVISTKKLVRSNCPFLESLDTCFLMSSFFS